jgi:ubiquinone/menaquinone biosynthesis C-methylase UbiE
MKRILKLVVPPIVVDIGRRIFAKSNVIRHGTNPKKQATDIYYDEDFADELETWGEASVWREIEMFMSSCTGKVLDVACGTGVNIKSLEKFPIEVHGFDLSDLLIKRAKGKGIADNKLYVQDATKTTFTDSEFDYSYSIGSLEHFTEQGIEAFLAENARYTSRVSFHMIPLSRRDKDEGWVTTSQSYFNNSFDWWLPKFQKHFSKVVAIQSKWEDGLSKGYWFVCYKSGGY